MSATSVNGLRTRSRERRGRGSSSSRSSPSWLSGWRATTRESRRVRPYPFILLNLVLSFQAAYTGPVVMMSQNRQAAKDRDEAEHDYDVNQKAFDLLEAMAVRLERIETGLAPGP